MHRCLKKGGIELHTIDISYELPKNIIKQAFFGRCSILNKLFRQQSKIDIWLDILKKSGVDTMSRKINPIELLNRKILIESPDVVYRFYPPNGKIKKYRAAASLLIIIEDL
jgi:hypothetical protein